MTTGGYREEVLNVALAQVLAEQGVISVPETVLRQPVGGHRGMPDIMVDFQGLRTVIEGKVDDQPAAEEAALRAARQRVERGIAHLGVALVYPASLRQVPFAGLKDALAHASLRMAVFSEVGESGWSEGNPTELADLLRRTHRKLIEEDVVTKVVQILDAAVTNFAHATFSYATFVQTAKDLLGIKEVPHRARKRVEDDEEE